MMQYEIGSVYGFVIAVLVARFLRLLPVEDRTPPFCRETFLSAQQPFVCSDI
jgi:hypothetical protein